MLAALDRCGGKLVTLILRRQENKEFKFILDYIEHPKTAWAVPIKMKQTEPHKNKNKIRKVPQSNFTNNQLLGTENIPDRWGWLSLFANFYWIY